ncbi:MAG TPA: DUF924 family protein [Kofleriaceae bacterium]|nr:DUF924 family protein [Kofleriaceae bacterium]
MIDDVIEFWFGTEPEPTEETMRRWFVRDDAFDAEIRTRFGALHARAAAGGLTDWLATPRGTLALLIVLDQFSRNLYRDDARAFAQDGRALAIARELWFSGRARELTPIQRMFVLLPFEHAEDREIQREGVAAFEQLAAEPGAPAMLAVGLDYARRHAEVIERFGRFPHRNEVLGRESTPEERAFLQQPGSRF